MAPQAARVDGQDRDAERCEDHPQLRLDMPAQPLQRRRPDHQDHPGEAESDSGGPIQAQPLIAREKMREEEGEEGNRGVQGAREPRPDVNLRPGRDGKMNRPAEKAEENQGPQSGR